MHFIYTVIIIFTVSSVFLSCDETAHVIAPQLEKVHTRTITLVEIDTIRAAVSYKDTNLTNTLLSPLDSLFPISFSRVDSIRVDSIIRTVHQIDTLYQDSALSAGSPDTTYDTLPGTWVHITNLKDTLRSPRFDTVKIMPLGNSITEGFFYGSYRELLWHMLDSLGYTADFTGSNEDDATYGDSAQFDYDTQHEGWSGWTTYNILDSLSGWILRQIPDIVLLHIGTNNSGESLDSVVNSVHKMIEVMRAGNPKIIILLAQIIPIYEEENWVLPYNKMLDSLGRAANTDASPIVVVDHYSGTDIYDDLPDGIHPNLTGNKKMAVKWLRMLRAALP
jgi:lysophospholipase L1-like esterase